MIQRSLFDKKLLNQSTGSNSHILRQSATLSPQQIKVLQSIFKNNNVVEDSDQNNEVKCDAETCQNSLKSEDDHTVLCLAKKISMSITNFQHRRFKN